MARVFKNSNDFSPVKVWDIFFSGPRKLDLISDPALTQYCWGVPVTDTKLINYLRSQYGAQFYKIKVKISPDHF